MYVKSTQTDTVSMETQRNDDEDEEEDVVQVMSSQSTVAPSEPEKVRTQCLFMSQSLSL